MAATDVGTGTAITFQSGLLGEITSLSVNGQEIPVIDVPNMADTGVFSRIFGRLAAPPTLEVGVNLDPDDNVATVLAAAAESVTITFPTPAGGTSGATWVFTGKATGFEADVPVENVMTGTFTITATTAITYTAST